MAPQVQAAHTRQDGLPLLWRAGMRLLLGLLLGGLVSACASATAREASDMVSVPTGDFTMGSSEEDIQWAAKTFFSESLDYYRDETPAHTVHLEAYEIDKHEVTIQAYQTFMQTTGHVAPKYMDEKKFNQPTQPVVGVNWQDAHDFCQWAGKRLPTEAEWEKAARGTDRRHYPWGRDPVETFANVRGTKDGFRYTAPGGSFPRNKSPYGAFDMAGNVWEWTADWYQPYPGNMTGNDLYGQTFRVMRGGSWFSNMDLARTAVRGKLTPDQRQNYIGFRCAR